MDERTPKQFRGAVYDSGEAVAEQCRGLPPDTAVFVAEAVTFRTEGRTFALDRVVLDAAVYGGTLEASGATEFVRTLAQSTPIPRTVVVDIDFVESRGWAVIEFIAAWGAGLNGCDAEKVLPAIVAASGASTGPES